MRQASVILGVLLGGSLEGSMTAEQREKLRTQTPQEVRIMPEQVSTATPAEERK